MHFHLSKCIINPVIHCLKNVAWPKEEIKVLTCKRSTDQKGLVRNYSVIKSLLKTHSNTVKCQSLVHSVGSVMGRRWAGVTGFVCCLLFRSISFILHRCHSKIAHMLKFKHFVAPAGPSRLKTSSKKLQTLGLISDVGLQHLYRNKEMRKRERIIRADSMITGEKIRLLAWIDPFNFYLESKLWGPVGRI